VDAIDAAVLRARFGGGRRLEPALCRFPDSLGRVDTAGARAQLLHSTIIVDADQRLELTTLAVIEKASALGPEVLVDLVAVAGADLVAKPREAPGERARPLGEPRGEHVVAILHLQQLVGGLLELAALNLVALDRWRIASTRGSEEHENRHETKPLHDAYPITLPPDKSIDFDRVARYYDAHVRTELDLAFWVEQCRSHAGPHLELMCGTGRISLAVLRAGIELSCIDYSAQLLERLRTKLAAEPALASRARLVCADVRELAVDQPYRFAFIGFHAIAELTEPEQLQRALERIASVLAPGGVLLLSMHEPRVRGPECNGEWVSLGVHPIPERPDATVEVRARWLLESPASGLVIGEQLYIERDASGVERTRVELPVRFRLYEPRAVEELARAAGFEPGERWGSYALPLTPPTPDSRVCISSFVKPA
jgi:SAM-dependent methyltransferase